MLPLAATNLDRTFAALANPTRRAILERLSRGEASVTELVAPFGLSQPTISSHLRILEEAGLVERGRQANFRPVRLAAEPMAEAHRWIGTYAAFWERGLERLEDCARTLQEEDQGDGQDHRR
jgi:DNA-binding transcriptional ArsR family regulator